MRHGHGTTSNSAKERVRRSEQPARETRNEERNRQRSIAGGNEPDELGITQGQTGERGNTVNPRMARESGKIRH